MRNTARCTLAILTLATLMPTVSLHSIETDETRHRARLLEQADAVSPGYTTPLMRDDGTPVALFGDLNGDDETDVTMLTIVLDERIDARAQVLADPLRLYTDDAVEPIYILESFYFGQETIVTVDLGRRRVWSDLRLISLAPGTPAVAVQVEFRSREGRATELVVFQGGLVSRVSLMNSRNRRGELVDIDGDGTLDLVTALRVPEAGRGYETFLELHELTRTGFQRTRTVPLVRSANALLQDAGDAMRRSDWQDLASLVLQSDPSQAVDFASVFQPASFDDEFDETDGGGTEEDGGADDGTTGAAERPVFDYPRRENASLVAVFPRLTDNPLTSPYRGQSFRVIFRVECCEAIPHFFEARVGMSRNPFREPVFSFLTEDGTGK